MARAQKPWRFTPPPWDFPSQTPAYVHWSKLGISLRNYSPFCQAGAPPLQRNHTGLTVNTRNFTNVVLPIWTDCQKICSKLIILMNSNKLRMPARVGIRDLFVGSNTTLDNLSFWNKRICTVLQATDSRRPGQSNSWKPNFPPMHAKLNWSKTFL